MLIHPYPMSIGITFVAISFAIATNYTWTIFCTKTVSKLLFQLGIVTSRFFFAGKNCKQKCYEQQCFHCFLF